MKFVLLLLYTVSFQGILGETVQVKDKCQCSHIQLIEDCIIDCQWDYDTQKCQDQNRPLIRTGYCSNLRDNCNKTQGCANYNGVCVPFTGCSAIKRNTNYECQMYSELCITDGSKCVEKSVCADYKTRFSCRNNYINYEWSGFCYWDKKECKNAESCHELSFGLKNDAECREQLSWCTFKQGGGCEDSGVQCKDQKFQQQCVTNRKRNVKCFWDGLACNDYSCKYIKGDCIKNGCSIDKDSYCMDRLECEEYTIQKSCTYNKSNVQCMWEANQCRIKSCENASANRQTNQQCQEIDSICITKFGGGCKKNGECGEANSKQGCSQNTRGDECYWNGYLCVIKQCQWAPAAYYKEKDICKDFQSDCVYGKEMCIEAGCQAQSTQDKCNESKQCKWMSKCDVKTCETAGRNVTYTTHQDCQNYLSNCTLSDSGIGCMLMRYSCNQYTRQIQCYHSILSKCTWHNNQCLESKCEYYNYSTHEDCNYELQTCTSDGSQCISLKSNCSQYTQMESCKINKQNYKCSWKNGEKDECVDLTCDMISKSENYSTHQDCNTQSPKCTVLERITGCIETPSDCSLLNQQQCYGKKCIYSNGECREKQCSDYKGDITQNNCEAFIEGKKCMRGPGLIPNSCVAKVAECRDIQQEYQCEDFKDINNNKCRWDYSFCIKQQEILIRKQSNNTCINGSTSFDENFCIKQKSCTDPAIATADYTDEICENYLITCQMQDTKLCKIKSDLDSNNCGFYKTKTNCIQQSHCYWANSCKGIQNSCDALETKDDCQDNKDTSGTFCIWDADHSSCKNICDTLSSKNQSCSTQDSKCVLKGEDTSKCIKKKQNCSDYTRSREECQDDDRCTYNSNELCVEKQCSDLTDSVSHDECNSYKSECTIAYPGGCSNLQSKCSDYKTQIQCVINNDSKPCYWSEYKGCVDKKCAEISYDPTVGEESQYLTFCYFDKEAKKYVDLSDSCTKYSTEIQCQKQLDGYECIWQDDKCKQATCETIILGEYNHQECYNQNEKLKCTVNLSKDKCTNLFSDCKQYSTQEQCVTTTSNEGCVWNSNYQTCNFKTCQDKDITDEMKCSDYLSTCIDSITKCRNLICEDYEYDNDVDCRNSDSRCTSNGRFCILRGTCEQNQYKQACNIDVNNKLCSWNYNKNQCSFVQCRDAPNTLTRTQDCETYFPNQSCVTKTGGGCLVATSCYDLIQFDCEQSKTLDCIWDNDVCRFKECKDYKTTYVLDCQSKSLNCTTDGVTCVEMKNCAQYYSKQTCNIGTDGVCIYLDDRCQPYKNCQSIYYTSHQQCYDSLQQQCTSNGTQCIPITFCNEYKDKISCVLGIDGDCGWESSKCVKFSSCGDYHFKTHEECNSINSSCTTDTVGLCIQLLECSKYGQKNCMLDKNGVVKKDGLIIKQNQCVWKNQECTSITCQDMYGTNHSSCYSQMSTCTSDGTKCLVMESECSSYSQTICEYAYSKEGKCSYVSSKCSKVDCSTITIENQCKGLKHCQFINGSCQSYIKCQEYKTEKDCTVGTDGQCVFTNSKCSLMTDCTHANQQKLCPTRTCYWNEKDSTCQQHTCNTYALQNSCGSFYNFKNTVITYCAFNEEDRACKETSPSLFTPVDCYKKSFGYFSNNNGTCSSCSIKQNNTDNNHNNTDNGTGTNSYNAVNFALIIIVLLIVN